MAIHDDKKAYSEALKEYIEESRPWVVEYKRNYRPGTPGVKTRLTDEQVIACRLEWPVKGSTKLSKEYGVSRRTMDCAIKGITFQHLNIKHKPWL